MMTVPVNNGSAYLANAGEGTVPLWPGVYAGTVVNNNDPLGVGRLQLNVPQVLGNAVSAWAVPLGTYYSIPGSNTPVACSFIGGDPSQPTWIGPLDLDPVINSGITAVYYTPGEPADPKVGDIWYQVFTLDGTVFYGPAQIWTFNSGTSTFSWVASSQSGAGSNTLGVVEPNVSGGTITGATFIGANWIENSSGSFYYAGTPANGNLISSVAGVAGTDAFGNAYPGGLNTSILNLFAAQFTNDAVLESSGTGVALFNGPFLSSGGNPMHPSVISTDTWHPMTLLHGWAAGSGVAPQYRLVASPPNSVEIIGSLNGASETSGVFFTLPSGYVPVSNQMVPCGDTSTGVTGVFISVASTGNLTMAGSSLVNNYSFHGFISLDA